MVQTFGRAILKAPLNNQKINELLHDEYDRKRGQIPDALNKLSGGNEIAEGEYNSDSYNVTDGEAVGYNAGLDKEAQQRES